MGMDRDGTASFADIDRQRRFEHIFDVAYVPVQRYVRRRGGGDDTDDVVAETFTVVWRRLDDVPADAIVPWCLGVARRVLANQRRSTKRRLRLAERVAAEPLAVDIPTDPDLERALARLDDERREVLRLWAWEGYGAGEIGTVLGISANAASIRLHRARRDLAEILGSAPGKIDDPAGHSKSDGTNAVADRAIDGGEEK